MALQFERLKETSTRHPAFFPSASHPARAALWRPLARRHISGTVTRRATQRRNLCNAAPPAGHRRPAVIKRCVRGHRSLRVVHRQTVSLPHLGAELEHLVSTVAGSAHRPAPSRLGPHRPGPVRASARPPATGRGGARRQPPWVLVAWGGRREGGQEGELGGLGPSGDTARGRNRGGGVL